MKVRFGNAIVFSATLAVLAFGGVACMEHHHHEHGDMKGEEGEEHEQKISVDQVPAAVKAAVMQDMPGATITDAEKEMYEGKSVYELDVKTADKAYEVKVSEDGKIVKKEVDDEKDEKDEKVMK